MTDDHESVDEIISSGTPTESESTDSEEEVDMNWKFITVLILLSWIYWSLGFKAGCWFSLVEVSWRKSFTFPLIMVIGLTALAALAKFLSGVEFESPGQAVTWLGGAYLAAMLITILFMKKYLDCKWRSLFTVWIMTSVMANILVILSLSLIHI